MVSTRLICSPRGNRLFTTAWLACRDRNVTGRSYCHFRGQFRRSTMPNAGITRGRNPAKVKEKQYE